MSEWWTYRLVDFLMFSPRTYWRLVATYNQDVWPLQCFAILAGVALIWLAARGPPAGARIVLAALALAWLAVGWGFHWQRYATINWGARYAAVAFAVEATLLLLVALARPAAPVPARRRRRGMGLALALAGVLLYPMLSPAMGRPWLQAEVFGVMPEPTALVTVGFVLALQPRFRWGLGVVPALSLALGAATRWLIG
jgi:hypothetical protein